MGTARNGSEEDFTKDPSEGKSHPVGKSIGTVAGAAAGAGLGAPAGPIGAVAGAAIGAIAGYLEGKTVAEGVNPDKELKYWRDNFGNRPYAKNKNFKDFEPAYMLGVYAYEEDGDFDELDADMENQWENVRGDSKLTWKEASSATKDAWGRLSNLN